MERIAGTPVSFVNVSDRERALNFYCGTLGLNIHSSDGMATFLDLHGGLLRMTAMPDHKPDPHRCSAGMSMT
jgi:catechol-2,3-dioxygenase